MRPDFAKAPRCTTRPARGQTAPARAPQRRADPPADALQPELTQRPGHRHAQHRASSAIPHGEPYRGREQQRTTILLVRGPLVKAIIL
jgi:hypothetical protein